MGAAQGSWTPFSSPSGEQRGGTSAVISGREGLPRGACREGLGRFRPVRRLGLRLPSMFGARACSCRKASGGLRSHWDLHDWRLAGAPAWARDVMGSWGGVRLLEWVPSGVGPIWEWDAVGIRGKGPQSGVGTIRGGNQFRARDAVGIGCEPCGGGRSKEGSLIRAGVAQARDGRERVWAVRSEPGGSELAGRWRARLIRVGIRVQREKPNKKRERKSKQGRTCTNL